MRMREGGGEESGVDLSISVQKRQGVHNAQIFCRILWVGLCIFFFFFFFVNLHTKGFCG